MGIPEYEATLYEGNIKAGNILSSGHTDDREQRTRAKPIFEQAGTHDVSSTGESSVPSEKRAAEAGSRS